MSKEIERIKIRLNRVTILSIREFKRLKYGDMDIPISDSYVISEAYRLIIDKIEKIDWEKVNKFNVSNVSDDTDFPTTSLPTTLSLDEGVLLGLRNIQQKLIEEAKGRIFFSFVVKIVLLAGILEINGQLEECIME